MESRSERATEWVSFVEAARLVGVAQVTIQRMARDGLFDRPEVIKRQEPSLGRASVERVAASVQAAREETRRRREERQAKHEEQSQPPDVEHVWLTTNEAAAVLDLTPRWVTLRAREERIPGTRRGRRWWFRREDVEALQAARVFRDQLSGAGGRNR